MDSPSKPRIKRRRRSTSPRSPAPNPAPHDMDLLLESALTVSDPSTSTAALNLSFDRILDSLPCYSDKVDCIQRALSFGTLFIEAAKLSARKAAAMHSMDVWSLPTEITVYIFTMIDAQSLCYAAATCSFFRKCAEDSACYTDIDLTSTNRNVDDAAVLIMIQRAGTSLRSLKLGPVTHPINFARPLQTSVSSTETSGISWDDMITRQRGESSILSRFCLTHLCASGFLLKRLHLYNIKWVDNFALKIALSACPSLIDIGIVGLQVLARSTLESVSTYCPLTEHLFFEASMTDLGTDYSLKLLTCSDIVRNCPNMSYLALRGFRLHDYHAREFVKGFHQLKYIDFSASSSMTGSFLKGLGGSVGGRELEVLVLRDCSHLKNVEVTRFLSTILAGDFKHLKYFDISNQKGLASAGNGSRRCFTSSFIPLDQLRDVRPELCLVAEFPAHGSDRQRTDVHQHSSSSDRRRNDVHQHSSGSDETTSSDSVATASTSDSDQLFVVYLSSSDSDSSY